MTTRFPEEAWVRALKDKLNSDEAYARIARNWEGELIFKVQPDEWLTEPVTIYLDLWHGTCREALLLEDASARTAAFVLTAPYRNFVRILKGEWQAMQAIMTRKLKVQGNMLYMMRNVPTVLDFVRCCREITTAIGGGEPDQSDAADSDH